MGVTIMGGELKGRKLLADRGRNLIRPTSGKVREALFSSLGGALEGSTFVDLFAGSGSVGLEAFSRGAGEVHAVENHPKSWSLLLANIKQVVNGPADQAKVNVLRLDAFTFCRRMRESGRRFDFVFADPPFAADYSGLKDAVLDILAAGGTGIIQYPTRHPPSWLEESVENGSARIKRYGESGLAYLRSRNETSGAGTREVAQE